jgi:hypothetical protein
MVTRKPVPSGADASLSTAQSPPYPVTPTAQNVPQPFRMQDVRDELRSPQSEQYSSGVWSAEVVDKFAGHDTGRQQEIPDSLRVGPSAVTQEMRRPSPSTTNPYLHKMNAQGGPMNDGKESSASAWGGFSERPAPPTEAPPPPPVPKGMGLLWMRELANMLTFVDTPPPTDQFSSLSVSEHSNNPWQPALTAASSGKPSPLPSLHRQDSGNEAWSAAPPARQAPTVPDQQPVLVAVDDPESPAWDEDEPESPVVQEMPATPLEPQPIAEEQNAWDDGRGQTQHQLPATSQFLIPEDPAQQGEGWNLVDHEGPGQHSGIITADGAVLERFTSEGHAPALPPRRSQEQPPLQPPRPAVDTTNISTATIASPATAAARAQKKETYEVKKITWHDVTAANNPRVSPILVQNANGPCPLLALVNALTLSTPADVETALVETLRSREQVSLGLLLDAVFDELMSGRRGDAAQELPDVSDLYQFLLALHTGMNVNPRFFPAAPSKSAADPRNSMSHIHPSDREAATPGTFEETREMKLYSTFSIPLIHGWLPDRDSPAYASLKRSANSYEDAQNLMFREEELEDKLQREGLSFEEQATLEDIATIKAFFTSAATQLTPFGLETITTSLAPGAVAILFRNDHFSTLYRHPETLQLLQLVTDTGYLEKEEVVWESLIDVNGENAEFFSGDFRLVGGGPPSPVANYSQPQSNEGWTTVPIRTKSHQRQSASNSSNHIPQEAPPKSPNTEQEDHDLALALQLQEEEEERHRVETARRQRETELSQQYIEQQGQQNNNVPVSQRGGGGRGGRPRQESNSAQGRGGANLDARPAIPPRRSGPNAGGQPIDPEAGVDAPPPSYEQAANQAAYVPPANHPAHPNASPNNQRRMSAYSATAAQMGSSPPAGRGSRRGTLTLVDQGPGRPIGRVATGGSMRGQGLNQQQQDERSKDCIVM